MKHDLHQVPKRCLTLDDAKVLVFDYLFKSGFIL
jgi:hypothetical protein